MSGEYGDLPWHGARPQGWCLWWVSGPALTRCSTTGLMSMVSIRACLDTVLNHGADVYGEYQGLCRQCLTMGLMSMVIKYGTCLNMVLDHGADVYGEYEGLPQHGAQPQRWCLWWVWGPALTWCSTTELMFIVSMRACLDTVLDHGADVYGKYEGLSRHGARPRNWCLWWVRGPALSQYWCLCWVWGPALIWCSTTGLISTFFSQAVTIIETFWFWWRNYFRCPLHLTANT